MGKTMEEWLRFSVCFWHTFRGTGNYSFCQKKINKNTRHDTIILCFIYNCIVIHTFAFINIKVMVGWSYGV
jgi:xylose isomerase